MSHHQPGACVSQVMLFDLLMICTLFFSACVRLLLCDTQEVS